jgi:lipid II:glycine glycyltransferase (peptidoglycan interpeptide bridge formation enzyme)
VVTSVLLRLGLRRARHDLQAPTTRLLEIPGDADEAALMAGWDKDARNLARRSRKEGVETDVTDAPSADDLSSFHGVLTATAERGSFRLRPLAFFERLFADAAPGRILLVMARLQDRPIGGMALLLVGDRAFYLYGGSLREPELKNTHAAYGAMAAAVGALSSRGIGTLDLWGVVEADDTSADPAWEGFSAFKRQFGGRPLRHPGTFDLVLDPLWYRIRDTRERVRDRFGR